MPRSLLTLRADDTGLFDAASAVKLATSGARMGLADEGGVVMGKTSRVTVKPDGRLRELDAFTLAVQATPESVSTRQVLVDSEQPPVRLAILDDGAVEASVHTENGWESVTSAARLSTDEHNEIRFVRADDGELILEINGKSAGKRKAGATLEPTGRKAMSIGTDLTGKRGFVGTLGAVELLPKPITVAAQRKEARRIKRKVAEFINFFDVPINIIGVGEAVDHRFDQIKAIMRAAGVEDLSALSTLTISQPTSIVPNQILTAPPKTLLGDFKGSFAGLAADFTSAAAGDMIKARELLDTAVVSRNTAADPTPVEGGPRRRRRRLDEEETGEGLRFPAGAFNPLLRRMDPSLTPTMSVLRDSVRLAPAARGTAALVGSLHPALTAEEIVAKLDHVEPHAWPTYRSDITLVKALHRTIPVDTSVIIAGRLDLTNTTLDIASEVETLYIIAEEVQASAGARITWRRPTLSVPDHGEDPGKDGRGWGTSNVVLKPDSDHGMDGFDGLAGDGGIAGRHAPAAPNIEIWAKRFVGMPDIDLAGQEGGRGGKGQRGGHGGSGARGASGEWYWLLGANCWDDPGDGGDGGHGARGGGGGRGGNGGDGGRITLAVLPETLDELTTTNAFTPLINGGAVGRGGGGGDGGNGGPGGMRGYTEVCDGGRAGRDGSQGQPGAGGPDGNPGNPGHIQILTVTEEAWDEQLTRPWITHLTPVDAFPGTVVTIRGSRFADTDRVIIGPHTLNPTLRADEGLDITLPDSIVGGLHTLLVRRHDGEESNRLEIGVRPHLATAPPTVTADTDITLAGKAFVAGATISLDGALYPANVTGPTSLTFQMPGLAGVMNAERLFGLKVINPDGRESNQLTAVQARVLQSGFRIGVHDYSFDNFNDGVPSWSTFEQTFGGVEVWHELLDPVFGHPILTGAFFAFYSHFLIGKDNGGLATGFCTSLASTALDRFWQGHNDTFATQTKAGLHEPLTAIHGRLLSRENLLTMHDQGRQGRASIEAAVRGIEATFASGGTRETAPLLFFIPSGAAWDSGYFEKLADSHCVVPVSMTFPIGYDGSDLNGIDIQVWDNNEPGNTNCRVEIRRDASGELQFEFFSNGARKYGTADGITLGMQTVGQYLLSDVDLPFSGAFGLTSFIIDFLLSPASLQVTDGAGRRTGHVGAQILSEIPGSHPAYMLPGLFLLPAGEGMTRTITGTAAGSYGYTSINPAGVSLNLRNVPTAAGEADIVAANGDGTRTRFIPSQPKTINASVATEFGGQARGIEIEGFQASNIADLDITATPDLALVRIANHGADASLPVKLLGVTSANSEKVKRNLGTVNVPSEHDLVIAVSDWETLAANDVTATAVDMS